MIKQTRPLSSFPTSWLCYSNRRRLHVCEGWDVGESLTVLDNSQDILKVGNWRISQISCCDQTIRRNKLEYSSWLISKHWLVGFKSLTDTVNLADLRERQLSTLLRQNLTQVWHETCFDRHRRVQSVPWPIIPSLRPRAFRYSSQIRHQPDREVPECWNSRDIHIGSLRKRQRGKVVLGEATNCLVFVR